jgi:hypothetical protein
LAFSQRSKGLDACFRLYVARRPARAAEAHEEVTEGVVEPLDVDSTRTDAWCARRAMASIQCRLAGRAVCGHDDPMTSAWDDKAPPAAVGQERSVVATV